MADRSYIDDLDASVASGMAFDKQNVPKEKRVRAELYYLKSRADKLANDPNFEARDEVGAQVRNEFEQTSSALNDFTSVLNQFREGNVDITDFEVAPEMGFETGKIINQYEDPRDIQKQLGKALSGKVPKGAKVAAYDSPTGDGKVWGYIADSTFYRLSPETFYEDPAATAGAAAAHPFETMLGVAGAIYPGLRGAGLVKSVAWETAGAGIGRAIDETMEESEFQGTDETIKEVAGSMATTAAVGSAFEGVSRYLFNPRAAAKSITEFDKITNAAENVADWAGTTPYKVSSADLPGASPLQKRIRRLGFSLFKRGKKNQETALTGGLRAMNRLVQNAKARGGIPMTPDGRMDWQAFIDLNFDSQGGTIENPAMDAMLDVVDGQKAALFAETRARINQKGFPVKAGESAETVMQRAENYKQAISNYLEADKAITNRLYDKAERVLEVPPADLEGPVMPPEFRLEPLKAKLNALKRGETVLDINREPIQWSQKDLSPEIQNIVSRLDQLGADQHRMKVKTQVAAKPGVSYQRELVNNRWRNAKDVYTSIKAIKRDLQDIVSRNTDSDSGYVNATGQMAQGLADVTTEIMKAPQNAPAAFRETLENANKLYSERRMLQEFLKTGRVLDKFRLGAYEEATNDLYRTIDAGGAAPETLTATLKAKLKPEEFKDLQTGYVEHLIRNFHEVPTESTKWSQAQRKFIPDDVRQLLTKQHMNFDKINRSDFMRVWQDSLNDKEAIRKIVTEVGPERAAEVLPRMGLSKDAYKQYRLNEFFRSSVKESEGRPVVDPQRYAQAYKALDDEFVSTLEPAERKLISDIDTLTSFIKTGDNIAVSLEAMTIMSNLTSLNPVKMAGAAAAMVRYDVLDRLMANPSLIRMLQKASGKKPPPRLAARALVFGTSSVVDDILGIDKGYSMSDRPTRETAQ